MDFKQYSELYHHGIKGMRWGVRRYQNPDGSLTPEGKNRLRKLNDSYAYLQEGEEGLKNMDRLFKRQYTEEEEKYMPSSSKAFMNYASISPTFNTLKNFTKAISKPVIKKYKKTVDTILKEFEDQGITLQEMDEMRSLYTSDAYVRRVFKQYGIKS